MFKMQSLGVPVGFVPVPSSYLFAGTFPLRNEYWRYNNYLVLELIENPASVFCYFLIQITVVLLQNEETSLVPPVGSYAVSQCPTHERTVSWASYPALY